MAVVGDGCGTTFTSSAFGVASVSDVWELPPSNVMGQVMLGGIFGWDTGPLAATVAVLSARTQQADGSTTFVPLSSDTDAVNSPHAFWDPSVTEITFGLQVHNGIAWLQDYLTFQG